jgi:DNA-binding NtrC family response regulator
VGGTREYPVHFRLVAAAKPEIEAMVKARQFIPDLYYRLNVLRIPVPSLRERPEDIPSLILNATKKCVAEGASPKQFLVRTVRYFERYSWPGNVRELENLIYSLLDLSRTEKIGPDQLDAKFFQTTLPGVPSPTRVFNLKQRLDDVEKQHLISVLQVSKTLREAARKMDVSLTTVLRLLKKHALTPENILGVHAASPSQPSSEGDRP